MDLHVALDEIEWGDGHVSEAAAEDAAGCARSVVLGREHGYPFLTGRLDHEARALLRGWRFLGLHQTWRRRRVRVRVVEETGDPWLLRGDIWEHHF